MVYDGTLLESAECLADSPVPLASGEIWQRLQEEKTEVSQNLVDEGSLIHEQMNAGPESDPSDEVPRELDWLHRGRLEYRLREISEAQDRLIDGLYGQCIDCWKAIETARLIADPAVARCLACQSMLDGRVRICSL